MLWWMTGRWQSLGRAFALLIGTWRFREAGAIAIGPEPGSTEWYSRLWVAKPTLGG